MTFAAIDGKGNAGVAASDATDHDTAQACDADSIAALAVAMHCQMFGN